MADDDNFADSIGILVTDQTFGICLAKLLPDDSIEFSREILFSTENPDIDSFGLLTDWLKQHLRRDNSIVAVHGESVLMDQVCQTVHELGYRVERITESRLEACLAQYQYEDPDEPDLFGIICTARLGIYQLQDERRLSR